MKLHTRQTVQNAPRARPLDERIAPVAILQAWRSDAGLHVPLLPSGSWRSWRAC